MTGLLINALGPVRQVYELVRAAGPAGVSRAAVRHAFPDRPGKSMDTLLRRLLDGKAIAWEEARRVLVVDGQCVAPVMRGTETPQAQLLDALAEYPAGVATRLLADDVGMQPTTVARHLRVYLERGRVRAITMPDSHGGGDGYVLAKGPAGAPAREPQAVDYAAAEVPAGDCRCRLLPGDGFEIAWDGAQVVLPPHVTRAMFRQLDQLGGLHLSEQLATPAAGA